MAHRICNPQVQTLLKPLRITHPNNRNPKWNYLQWKSIGFPTHIQLKNNIFVCAFNGFSMLRGPWNLGGLSMGQDVLFEEDFQKWGKTLYKNPKTNQQKKNVSQTTATSHPLSSPHSLGNLVFCVFVFYVFSKVFVNFCKSWV